MTSGRLTLKGLATPLLGAGLAIGVKLPPILILPFVALPYGAAIAISRAAVTLIELGGLAS